MNVTLEVSYRGHDPTQDRFIEQVVRKRCVSSGYCFVDNERCLTFTFRKSNKATNAAKRLRRRGLCVNRWRGKP